MLDMSLSYSDFHKEQFVSSHVSERCCSPLKLISNLGKTFLMFLNWEGVFQHHVYGTMKSTSRESKLSVNL